MKFNLRKSLAVISLLIFSAIWIWISSPDPDQLSGSQPSSPAIGFLAPDFESTTIEGDKVWLADQRGKVVLVNFWASWCPPCRSEMPAMQTIFSDYSPEELKILAVNATNIDSDTAAFKFIQDNKLRFPVVFDRDGSINQLYRTASLPTTFFIDQNGYIQDIIIGGPMSEAFLRIKIDELIRSGD